ncbi:intracellular sulfur oxidation DsrE/DsrF family protein [Lewinella aquimaris]|uniref:Intracellular sulfur oxidation DsrE/DsrF family protein n=1 Tax=Neolewinella aquimaris TaxID=1835722 RepID=A0A840E8H8_9BACT|nr:DsrE family protein [Neolewinella aquimaris]MBB4079617.1 intracellular sulfur oxidation DsrE/DsrF family protein [Neolewinella aquimaris]
MRTLLFLIFFAPALAAQEKVTPVVPFGGIYDVPEATVLLDTNLTYNFVVDVASGSQEPDSLSEGLYRVARMINLFAVGGVPDEKVTIVLAIHAGATVGVMDNAHYRERFGVDNPNIELIRSLKQAGVRVTVCGQSLLGRNVPPDAVIPEVEIATSMLTTVAMYQMKGYGVFKF